MKDSTVQFIASSIFLAIIAAGFIEIYKSSKIIFVCIVSIIGLIILLIMISKILNKTHKSKIETLENKYPIIMEKVKEEMKSKECPDFYYNTALIEAVKLHKEGYNFRIYYQPEETITTTTRNGTWGEGIQSTSTNSAVFHVWAGEKIK